ncbi:MAG: Rieske 2Fe-2S domain-containing protein [Betaproteobacteria bacterium]
MALDERLICASKDLRDGGTGVRFVTRSGGVSRPAFAIRWCGAVHAYVNECRHQASELDWESGDFFDASKLYLICATHGALYEPDSGLCVAGPCRGARLKAVMLAEHHDGIYCIEN